MRDKFVAVLSGDNVSMANAELKALLNIFHKESIIIPITHRLRMIESSRDEVLMMISRAGYLKSIIQPIIVGNICELDEASLVINDPSEIIHSQLMIRAEKFGASNIDSRFIEKKVFEILSRFIPNLKISFKSPSCIVKVYVEDDMVVGGLLLGVKYTKSMNLRRPGKRPFTHPSALHPKLARCLVNLSRTRIGGYILDPFMGTGSIPLEASLMGYQALGIELKSWMCLGAVKNIKTLGDYSKSHVLAGDSRSLMFVRGCIDGIATDPPYGRSTTILEKELSLMLEKVFVRLIEVIKKDAHISIALPENTPFIETLKDLGLKIEECIKDRVHSTLTREIIVCVL